MIPCLITTFNQLTWTQEIECQVGRLGMRPVVVDLGSTYPPLLEWLDGLGDRVVRRSDGSQTPVHWFWKAQVLADLGIAGHYAVTDPDLDLAGIPADCLQNMIGAFDANPDVTKAGVSLEIDDLPDNPRSAAVRKREERFWRKRRGDLWEANIASTLAVYHTDRLTGHFYKAVRLDRPYTARHRPWYLTANDYAADDELSYYLRHARNQRAHWTSLLRADLGIG